MVTTLTTLLIEAKFITTMKLKKEDRKIDFRQQQKQQQRFKTMQICRYNI